GPAAPATPARPTTSASRKPLHQPGAAGCWTAPAASATVNRDGGPGSGRRPRTTVHDTHERGVSGMRGAMRKAARIGFGVGVILAARAGPSARAGVKPNNLFTDGAVLQRGVKVPVWGTARNGEAITVSFQGQELSTTAREGKWRVDLAPMEAGGPWP